MKVSGWKLLAIVSGLAGVAVLLIFLFRPSESVEQAARNYLRAFLDRDAARLLRYARAEEKEISGLNEAKLRQFFEQYLWPRLSGFRPSGEPEIMRFEMAGAVQITQNMVHEDGRATQIPVLVFETGDGPQVIGCVYLAMFSAYLVTLPPGESYPLGSEKYRFYRSVLLDEIEHLERSGIDRVAWVTDNNFSLTKLTWRQAADHFRDVAVKIDLRHRTDQ